MDIVEYLLEIFPQSAATAGELFADNVSAFYPLHAACFNDGCSSSVIRLLLRKYPSAVDQLCNLAENYGSGNGDYDVDVGMSPSTIGLPLHLYLSRTSNIELDRSGN